MKKKIYIFTIIVFLAFCVYAILPSLSKYQNQGLKEWLPDLKETSHNKLTNIIIYRNLTPNIVYKEQLSAYDEAGKEHVITSWFMPDKKDGRLEIVYRNVSTVDYELFKNCDAYTSTITWQDKLGKKYHLCTKYKRKDEIQYD